MSKVRKCSFLLLVTLFLSCNGSDEGSGERKAERVVNKAIEHHRVELLEKDTIEFDFREHHYVHAIKDGRFYYERKTRDTGRSYRDILTNDAFTRYRGGKPVELPKEDSIAYANALNSVVYFAFLPYRLNDPGVEKTYSGIDSIDGKSYHRIKVTFEGDPKRKKKEDIYIYWFDRKDHSMDYLAYRFFTDGGGVRFREAYDRRRVDGMIVQDYRNYKAPEGTALEKLDELWEEGELERVSVIRTQNVTIR